jgi:hypothetical protein
VSGALRPPASLPSALLALLALAVFCAAVPGAAAAAPSAVIRPSFAPDSPGARTSFAFAYTLRDPEGEGEVPSPLRTMQVRLPAGLGIDLRGAAGCAPARLRSGGPAACPASSLLGRGHAQLEVHAGSQSIPEDAVVSAVRIPDRAGHPALAIFGRGDTPLQEQTISTATLLADKAPYGARLAVSIPPIPTLVLEPDASIISFSLTLGGVRPHAAGAFTVPRRCPPAGFPFAAEFGFADGSRTTATARVRCPGHA